jgi:hypothetical protein
VGKTQAITNFNGTSSSMPYPANTVLALAFEGSGSTWQVYGSSKSNLGYSGVLLDNQAVLQETNAAAGIQGKTTANILNTNTQQMLNLNFTNGSQIKMDISENGTQYGNINCEDSGDGNINVFFLSGSIYKCNFKGGITNSNTFAVWGWQNDSSSILDMVGTPGALETTYSAIIYGIGGNWDPFADANLEVNEKHYDSNHWTFHQKNGVSADNTP